MQCNKFISPAKIVIEQNGILSIGKLAESLGKKALICIGGSSFKKSGYLDKVKESLEAENIEYEIYEGIPSDPDIESVNKGVEVCRNSNCDMVIAIGGGSVLDAAKAIGLIANNSKDIAYYEKNKPENRMIPMIAVPTTVGTASEVSMYSIITDKKVKRKMVIYGEFILPDVALLDVNLTLGLPPHITAATGMDALTHAIESYVSDRAFEMTRMFALRAIELIMKNIHGATYNSNNIKAKESMLIGQMYAGLAFSNTSTALVHSMSRPLGVYYGIPHGEANAMLLATVMEYNLPCCIEEFKTLAKAVDLEPNDKSSISYAKAFVDRVKEIHYTLPLSKTISEKGAKESDLNAMAQDALASGSTWVNPRKPTVDEIIELYKKVM
ncbi:MAG TPA: alcohol dehydrogenase [Clostridium sp.]|nr:alcohol dehydrogenase [Clostridium sp.]